MVSSVTVLSSHHVTSRVVFESLTKSVLIAFLSLFYKFYTVPYSLLCWLCSCKCSAALLNNNGLNSFHCSW